jgi:hypothetical protein
MDDASYSYHVLCNFMQVHIVCRLHHDQLKPVFHVCRSLQQAVRLGLLSTHYVAVYRLGLDAV